MKEVVLNLAINGMIPTKEMTPHVPITPKEVVEDLLACNEVGGITYLHLHARDKQGVPTGDPLVYQEFIETIRVHFPELVICASCSGRQDPSFENRSRVLKLTGDAKPDMGSLTLSSLNFPNSVSLNSKETIVNLALCMQDNGIIPEIEIFDLGMMNFAHYMISKGYLKPPFYFNFILGNIFSAQATLSHLAALVAELPQNSLWSVGGIGASQVPAMLLALGQNGGVRTGIEDTIYMNAEKTVLATNPEMIKRVHDICRLSNLNIMQSNTFKSFLQSKFQFQKY